jgi:transposase-like protein
MKRHTKTNCQIHQEHLFRIQTIVTHHCPKCGSKNLARNGHDYKGTQKYHCKSCGRYGTLAAEGDYREAVRGQVKRTVLERSSLRGIARIFGLSRRTLAHWQTKFNQGLAAST